MHYPYVALSHKVVDFGVCYVGDKKELSFVLTNPSKAVLYWKIEKGQYLCYQNYDLLCVHTARCLAILQHYA